MDLHERDQDRNLMREKSISNMIESPYPVQYLETLLQSRLIDQSEARQIALDYITSMNRIQAFLHLAPYEIAPFQHMSLNDLITYIAFVHRYGLEPFKNRRLVSSKI